MKKNSSLLALVRVSILEPVITELARHGDCLKVLMEKYALPRDLLNDSYGVIPLTTYLHFFENSAQLTGDTAFGARTGANFRPASLGPVGMLINAMPTLRKGLAAMMNYPQPCTTITMIEEGKLTYWCYRIDDLSLTPRLQDSEYTLTATMRLIQSSFGMHWRPLEVHVEHSDKINEAFLTRFFEAPVVFGKGINRLVMPTDQLDKILRYEDKDLTLFLQRHLRDLLPEAFAQIALSEQIKHLLRGSIGQKDTGLKSMADSFNMSARTLQRKLSQSGTSLRQLREEVRLEMAIGLMKEKRMTHDVMAQSLGYADASVLWRAYKKWTGKTMGCCYKVKSDMLDFLKEKEN